MNYLNDDKIKNYLIWSNSNIAKEWRNINGPPALDYDLGKYSPIPVILSAMFLPIIIIFVITLYFIYYIFIALVSLSMNAIITDKFDIIEIDNNNPKIEQTLYASSFYDVPSNWLIKNGYQKLEFRKKTDTTHENSFVFVNTKTNSTIKLNVNYGNGKNIRLDNLTNVTEITLEQFDEENNFPHGVIKRIEDNGNTIRYIPFPTKDQKESFTIYRSNESDLTNKYYTLQSALD